MPTVTPQKLLLISMVIVLGAAAASLLPASKVLTRKSTMSYVPSTDAMQTKSLPRMEVQHSRREFVERMPFPYAGASGALHGNRDLEFDY